MLDEVLLEIVRMVPAILAGAVAGGLVALAAAPTWAVVATGVVVMTTWYRGID